MTVNDGGVTGTAKVVDHGLPAVRYNIVLMGDGYQNNPLQQQQYQMNVQTFVTALQSTPPFNNLWQSINIYRVDVWSTDSGADDPTSCMGGTGTTARTFFDASFCHNNVRRSLQVNNTTATNVANQQVPEWDMILVLVNSTIHGGTGGTVAVSSIAGTFSDIMIHEIGHTLFKLADEYEYNQGCGSGETGHDNYSGSEPDRPNVTINTNKNTIKWRDLILASTAVPTTNNTNCGQCDPQASPVSTGTVGAFEGAHHFHCSVFRPEFNCLMRNLGEPFCAVCSATIVKKLSERLGGIVKFAGIVGISGHYVDVDQLQHIVVGTTDGKAREVYWTRSQEEEPGIGVLKQFGANNIVGVAVYHGGNIDKNYHVIVGTKDGKVWELWWQGPNVPGAGVLKQFGANNIVGVAGHYVDVDQLHHVIVATRDGKVWELYWQGPNPATAGLLKQFAPNSVVGVAGYYSSNDQNYHVIVGTKDGKVWELWWQGPNVPGAGVLKQFGANSIRGVAAFYGGADQNHHVFVGTRDGKVYELYWQGPIQALSREIAAFPRLGITGVAGYYSPRDQRTHVIAATTDGMIREIEITPPPPIDVTVPNVIELYTETARQAIVNTGLVPVFSGSNANAKVIIQSPQGGAIVPIWSHVNLTVEDVVFVEVPYVREESPSSARQIVEQAGLVAKFTGNGSWVDGQSPQPGNMVPRGTTVTMHLSSHIPP